MMTPKPIFDFQGWFRWRLSRHTPEGEARRTGTLTLSETEIVTDLVYDYRRHSDEKEKRAKMICKRAIEDAGCLAIDGRGYYLKGEPRIRYDSMQRVVEEDDPKF